LANKWDAARKLELASVYLKGIALDWFQSLLLALLAFDNNGQAARSFKHLFRTHFYTPKQKAIWQKQLFEIKQSSDLLMHMLIILDN